MCYICPLIVYTICNDLLHTVRQKCPYPSQCVILYDIRFQFACQSFMRDGVECIHEVYIYYICGFPLSKALAHESITFNSWDTVERPLIKPNCCVLNSLFIVILTIRSLTQSSIHLHIILVRLTGL